MPETKAEKPADTTANTPAGMLVWLKLVLKRGMVFAKANKKVVTFGAVLLFIAILVLGSWSFYKNSKSCEDYIPKGNGSLDASQNVKVKAAVKKIISSKRYEKNPNCLNVVVTYDINTGDYINAQTDLNKLEKVYNPQKGFSKQLIDDGAKSMQMLRDDVAFLKKLQDQFLKNIKRLPAKR